jgi:ABC-2 type transport system ATP-binding protein
VSLSRTFDTLSPSGRTVAAATVDVCTPALAIRDAVRRLGDRLVLDHVSITVASGRIVVLAGPNGAGKSSLLRAITGRLRLDAGAVTIGGLSPAEARGQGRLGVVPQDLGLYPHLTVRENLAILGRLARPRAGLRASTVDEALQWAGLGDRARSLVRELSGGMRRRVNLVAGVLHRPALLLLDEPTVGVDGDSKARLHALLRDLRADGVTVLIATHDLDEAADLGDEVVLMAEGRVRIAGPPETLIAAAFPGGAELSITVEAGWAEAAAAPLARQAFRRTSAHAWVRPSTGGVAQLAATEQQLREAGIGLSEIRVTQPGLRGAVAVLLEDTGGARS